MMLEPPASAQTICCMALLSFLLDVFVVWFFFSWPKPRFLRMISEASTEKGKCWIELCSCLNTPGKAKQVSDPAWWSQFKYTVSPDEHISA